MDKIEMMREKFLMFAEKLWVSPENIAKMKEDFSKGEEKKEEMKDEIKEEVKEEVKEEMIPEISKDKEVVKVDIANPIENRMPTEEDLSKMSRDELLVCAKKLLNTPKKDTKDITDTPFMVMMKRQWY